MSGGISKTTSYYNIKFDTDLVDKNDIKKSKITRSHTDIEQFKRSYNSTPDVGSFVQNFYNVKSEDIAKKSNMLNRIDGTIGSPEFHPNIIKRKRSIDMTNKDISGFPNISQLSK